MNTHELKSRLQMLQISGHEWEYPDDYWGLAEELYTAVTGRPANANPDPDGDPDFDAMHGWHDRVMEEFSVVSIPDDVRKKAIAAVTKRIDHMPVRDVIREVTHLYALDMALREMADKKETAKAEA